MKRQMTLIRAALLLAAAGGLFLSMTNGAAHAQDVANVAGEADRPWLTINVNGHTAGVRALAFTPDSKRLCSAGLDKVVQVWNTATVVRDLRRTWLLERSIRWQVGRSLRGSIYAVASSPSDGLLAMAGYGATGGLGEIALVDPVDGTLDRVLLGHRQTVCSLAFSPDGSRLASLDVSGRLIVWKRGDWQPSVVYDSDAQVYGEKATAIIEQLPNVRPIALVGNTHVVVPVYRGLGADGQALWNLQQIGIENRRDVRTFEAPHNGMVSALAVSADGRQLASADLTGRLYLGPVGAPPKKLEPEAVVLSLCFDPRGQTLVVGTAVAKSYGKGQLELWDVATRTLKKKQLLADDVRACAVSKNGELLAYSGGEHHSIFLRKTAGFLYPLDPKADLTEPVPLRGMGRRVARVAFARNDPIYRVAFGTTFAPGTFNDYGRLEQSFDPTASELTALPAPQPEDWLTPTAANGSWQVEPTKDGGLQLFRDRVPKGFIRLNTKYDGAVRSYCWLNDAAGNPSAIVVGTDVQNTIYVFRLTEQGPCPVLRQFRGHQDFVTSLSVSADRRYLVSGSADGTVRFWSLSNFDSPMASLRLWGAEFAVADNQLTVARDDPAGPLFFKGVRQGDAITELRWSEAGAVKQDNRAEQLLRRLNDATGETQLVVNYQRNGQPQTTFQALPAWQPLATLFVTGDGQWAFWTPEGYYDASLNGHTLFGWQVNRGVDQLPDFFRADQFRKRLERPDVLQQLLPAGSFDRAFRLAQLLPPFPSDEAVRNQISSSAKITVLTPRSGSTVAEDMAVVRARIRLPAAVKLSRVRLFANGVVAPKERLIDVRDLPDGRESTYEWDARLPREERNLIQVIAGTDADTLSFGQLILERSNLDRSPKALPKMHVLAIGVDSYADPTVQPLEYSVADARAVVDMLKARATGLYAVESTTLLLNEQVTRANWKKAFTALAEKLRGAARPDDLLVIFLAGHGFVDPKTQRYYFASYDINREGFLKGDYAGSISWSDFELLSDVPCRKLALLDTCHSGAIQPLRLQGLKSAVRSFQEDVVLTLTASAGHERSEENADWGHGAFTKALLTALEGREAKSADGVVTLNDVVQQVQQSVSVLTSGRQNPTAAPEELLPFVSLRLTSVDKQARASKIDGDSLTPARLAARAVR